MAIDAKAREERLPHRLFTLCLVGLVSSMGCQAAPSRYHGTWHRATSPRHGFAVTPCLGFTPTFWSRWPDECQVYGGQHFEEIALPAELPMDTESHAAQQPPDGGERRQIPEPEFPPSSQPSTPASTPVDSETMHDSSHRGSRPLSTQTWSFRLAGYLKAVTRLP